MENGESRRTPSNLGFYPVRPESAENLGAPGDYFLINKANLPEGKIHAKSVFTKDYEDFYVRRQRENKPNSKPISGLGAVSREESAAQIPGVFPIYI